MNSSNWTGRTARTLEEAFGAYTSTEIYTEPERYRLVDKVLVVLFVLAWIIVPLAMFMGWI